MPRTPKDKIKDLLNRGRTLQQIRAIAVARDDKPLTEEIQKLLAEDFL